MYGAAPEREHGFILVRLDSEVCGFFIVVQATPHESTEGVAIREI